MLKGAQKRMVMLRTADSELFEAAYFILRDDGDGSTDGKQPTMLEEANRILDQSFVPRTEKRGTKGGRLRKILGQLPGFLTGLLLGGAICAVIFAAGVV